MLLLYRMVGGLCKLLRGEDWVYFASLRDFTPHYIYLFNRNAPVSAFSSEAAQGQGGQDSSRGRPVRCRRSRSRLCCAAWFRTRSRVAMVPAWRALTTHWSPQAMPR